MSGATSIECPDFFDVKFARRLVAHFGGDASKISDYDCWKSLGKKYRHLLPMAEKLFERATTGDPAWAAFCMVRGCGSKREWAEGVIERATTGDPSEAAWVMVRDCGSKREWAGKITNRRGQR